MRISELRPSGSYSQAVADLHWAVTSPLLVKQNATATLDWCGDFSNLQNALEQHLSQFQSHRVGYYFESLIHFWLRDIQKREIVGHCLQIHKEQRTVGEIDLLFKDESQLLHHWEVAVKFYLYHPQHTLAGSHYIGPNAGDTFERKAKKLFSKQLKLSEIYFPEVSSRTAFVKGCVFYHPLFDRPAESPERLSVDHLQGRWCYSNELELLGQFEFEAGMILKKPYWLASPIQFEEGNFCTPELLKTKLQDHFQKSHYPQLVSLMKQVGEQVVEVERLFVVHPKWPNI